MGVISSSKMNLQEAVNDILRNEYEPEVIRATAEVIPQVAKEAVRRLKSTSPKRSGKYAKGWAVEVEKTRVSVSATVYGKSGTFQLAHLLEFGHATRNGTGRMYSPTPAHPHIEEVESWANDKALKDITDKLGEIS